MDRIRKTTDLDLESENNLYIDLISLLDQVLFSEKFIFATHLESRLV